MVGAVLLLGYSYREDLRRAGGRMLGELMPGEPMVTQAGTVELRRGPDGHFHVVGTVNGTEVLFLVDTGASGVVLNQADARRIGFDPGTLAYTQIFNTANGQVTGAPVRLASMGVGPIVFRDVGASVNGGKLDRSLLGMSFLNRLSGFEIEGDRMTLRP